MDYLIICCVTLLASFVGLFSGFGFGTILIPVFILFFPPALGIALSAILHCINSLSQILLVGRYANWTILLKFAIPAFFAALIGGYLLEVISKVEPIAVVKFHSLSFNVTVIRLVIGLLIIFSSLFVLFPKLSRFSVSPKYIPLGGVLSGFFGGFAGYQGALRSTFLIKANLTKEEFIGTSSWCSLIVDISRIITYSLVIYTAQLATPHHLIGLSVAGLLAFSGTYIAFLFLPHISIKGLKLLIGVMLILLGFAILSGIQLNN